MPKPDTLPEGQNPYFTREDEQFLPYPYQRDEWMRSGVAYVHYLAPATNESIRLGCTCDPLFNKRGKGWVQEGTVERLFMADPACPIHSIPRPERRMNQKDAAKVRKLVRFGIRKGEKRYTKKRKRGRT